MPKVTSRTAVADEPRSDGADEARAQSGTVGAVETSEGAPSLSTMSLTLTGTAGPSLDAHRAGPGQVLRVGAAEDLLLFDCGESTATQLLRAGVDPAAIFEVFFTHVHADHTHGLTHFAIGGWQHGRRRLTLYGPPNLQRFADALFKEAYAEDLASRFEVRAPLGLGDMRVVEIGAGFILERDDYTITAAPGVHVLNSHGYRIEASDGRALVLTGDTAHCESIVSLARGAHTIVHECHLADWRHERTQPEFLRNIHSSATTAAQTARQAAAKRLVLVHLPPQASPERMVEEASKVFDGEIVVGEDLMTLEI